jgi:hypothetical protein
MLNRSRSCRWKPTAKSRTRLKLEFLETRTVPDASSKFAISPAMLNVVSTPGDPQPIQVFPPDGGGGHSGQRTPPNVLVNDPTEDGTSIHDTHSETSLTVTSDGAIVASWNDSLLINNNPIKLTGWAVSSDNGQTFVDKGVLPTSSFGGDAGDPSLASDQVSGRVYLATIAGNFNQINVFHSDDDGNTFANAVAGAPGRAGDDKEWLTVDNAPGAGQGNVYLVMRDFSSGNGIFLFRSTDQGDTFGPNGGVSIVTGGAVQGAWVTVGPDHSVYALWFDQGAIKMRRSTDQGLTFGSTVTVTTLRTNGVNGDLGLTATTGGGFRSNAFPQAVVNPVSGSIYVTFDDKGTGAGDKADVYFTQSNDNGATWSAPVKINDGPIGRDAWQPTITVTPNGANVGIFWYDRRNDPADNLIDRYGVVGAVAGGAVTFGDNIQITDQSFVPVFGVDPGIVSTYMGDYDQAVASTSGFDLTWGDNRDASHGHGGNHPNVRFATIPLATYGPAVLGASPRGNVAAPVDHVRITFDESVRPHSMAKIGNSIPSFTDPNGNPITVNAVVPVAGSNFTQYDVMFDPQTLAGTYTMQIGPHIRDRMGRLMDQDGDGMPGQPDDGFTATFTIENPFITAFVSNATFANPPSNVRVTFNEPMDPMTFSPDKVTSFLDPNGNPVTVNSVTPVTGSGNTQFDIAFDPQMVFGTYSMTVGPDIQDPYGNSMSAPFMGTFRYTNEAIVNGGFETGNFMGWTQSGNTGATGVSTGHPHSGMYAADLGPVGSEGFLSQSFATTPGAVYQLSYWLSNDGGTPNQFEAYIDNVVVPGSQLLNVNGFGYTQYTFDFTATGTTTELKFGFRQDPAYFHLDDVSVSVGAALASQGSGQGLALAMVTPFDPVSALATSPASSLPANTGINPVDQVLATAGNAQGAMDSGPTAMVSAQTPASSDLSLEGDLTGWLTM